MVFVYSRDSPSQPELTPFLIQSTKNEKTCDVPNVIFIAHHGLPLSLLFTNRRRISRVSDSVHSQKQTKTER